LFFFNEFISVNRSVSDNLVEQRRLIIMEDFLKEE